MQLSIFKFFLGKEINAKDAAFIPVKSVPQL
jgi:hypothetical protein